MQWSDIQLNPPAKTLRQFAGLWLACFGGLALWEGLIRRHASASAVFLTLALAIGPLGLVWPKVLRPIYASWMVLTFPIGWLISQLTLALIFYGLFTPIGLLFRLMGRDPLHLARPEGVETYWSSKVTHADLRRYFKQF
jgi:hypothetical protein